MKNRIKSPVREITREEAELAVNDIALAMNNRRKLVSEMDDAKLAAEQAAAPGLALIDETVAAATAVVQSWAEANPAEFGQKKSIEFPGGAVGFRTGTPAVKTLRKATWEAVLEAMRGLKRMLPYIRTVDAVAKDKILSDYEAGFLDDQTLTLAGMKIVQAETFFVEPDLTKFETRITEKTA